jgi:hypothetical protein
MTGLTPMRFSNRLKGSARRIMQSKTIFFFIVFFAAVVSPGAQAQDLPFIIGGEFDVDIYQYPHMILLDSPMSDSFGTVCTFVDRGGNYELRYSLFPQTEYNAANIHRSFALFIIPVINRAAGFEVDLNEVELYDEQDVADEFNADIGVSVFVPAPLSEFGSGYGFMLLSFFCKINQGIVMQTILFDNIEFAGTGEFEDISHSFEFY